MALTAEDRAEIRSRVARIWSSRSESIGVTKPEMRAAVDAIDDWIDANAASLNQALPPAARSALTARQKAELFFAVARQRFEVS